MAEFKSKKKLEEDKEIFLVFGKETKGLPEDLLRENMDSCSAVTVEAVAVDLFEYVCEGVVRGGNKLYFVFKCFIDLIAVYENVIFSVIVNVGEINGIIYRKT